MRRPRAKWLGLWCALSAASCIYDPDDRCDPGQRLDGEVCVCLDGMVPAPVGCAPCGENEVATGDSCACVDGFARATTDAPCEPVPEGLGAACDPAAADCLDSHPECHPSDFDGGYCTTTGCADDDDCEGGYRCDTRTSPSHCARPPVGVGAPCESHDDCAGTEATYCVTIMMSGCQVEGCSAPDVGCAPGRTCCDLSAVGLTRICVPEGACPG